MNPRPWFPCHEALPVDCFEELKHLAEVDRIENKQRVVEELSVVVMAADIQAAYYAFIKDRFGQGIYKSWLSNARKQVAVRFGLCELSDQEILQLSRSKADIASVSEAVRFTIPMQEEWARLLTQAGYRLAAREQFA